MTVEPVNLEKSMVGKYISSSQEQTNTLHPFKRGRQAGFSDNCVLEKGKSEM